MITAYKYKLRPNKAQAHQFDEWLNLLRMQYNYRLAERFNWFESTRCPINSCSLVSCSIAQIVEQPDYYWQKRDLLNTKKLFPEYGQIHSQVLQDCIGRVKKAFDRFISADKAGKRSGKPRFKGRGRYHSFTYTQMPQDCIKGNRITLSKIGDVKIILHRPIPDGFKIKTATIVKNADGWYYDVIGFEDLNVKGLARTRMAKSILDAGWSEFLDILICKAANAGKLAMAVNPNGTTQNCSNCGTRVPKQIQDRWHSCPVCGLELDRDVNAAINVKNLAVGRTVNKAQCASDAIAGLAEKPTLYSSAS